MSKFLVEDPATGQPFAEVAVTAGTEIERLVAAARAAWPSWRQAGIERRRASLLAVGAALTGEVDQIARLLTREQGKPLAAARTEVGTAADWFAHTAALELSPEQFAVEAPARATGHRTSHGVVAAIAPYNFPILLAVTKIAPALLAGNTVVVKPSPLTPLSTIRMVEVMRGVLPDGVLDIVNGGAAVGAALAGHPDVAVVSFTGSVATGRRIAESAAPAFKKVVLELGGNDACIVLPGADPAAIAPEIFRRSMVNSGQFCAAVKRVYVPVADQEAFAQALAAEADKAVVGDGMDPATDLGPLTSTQQRVRVDALVREAEAGGARLLAGGRPLDGDGYFYPATVVTDVPLGCRLEREEQFGPVIPLLGYRETAEAVAWANSTAYGLGGSVWGDPEPARRIAAELDCGTSWVNTHGDLLPTVPFGGFRDSGIGVEYGFWGLLEYTRLKVVHERA